MKYKVTVVQFSPKFLDVNYNLNRIYDLLTDIETDLIVLPELATSGYNFATPDEVKAIAESIPDGKSYNFFSNLAQKTNATIIYGVAEYFQDTIYNSSVLVNPDNSHYIYRKLHLFNREKLFFKPGNIPLHVYPAKDGVLIGMMICFDWQFPEVCRVLALNGAQIICHPSNLVLPWGQQAMMIRALENRVFTITANRTGVESNAEMTVHFTGQSQITNTIGAILCRMPESCEGFETVTIETDDANNKQINNLNNSFNDRRPEYYQDIIRSIYE